MYPNPFQVINEGQMYSSSTEYLDGFHYASSVGDDELRQMFQDAGGNAYEMKAFIAFTTETNFADVLKFFPTTEGYYDFENSEYIYQYKPTKEVRRFH